MTDEERWSALERAFFDAFKVFDAAEELPDEADRQAFVDRAFAAEGFDPADINKAVWSVRNQLDDPGIAFAGGVLTGMYYERAIKEAVPE